MSDTPRAATPVIGRAPAIVWLATAALGLLLTLWSVAVPAYRAPDEPQHLSTALRLASGGGYPHPGSATLLPEVASSYPWANFPGGDHRTFVPPRQVEQPQKDWPSFATLAQAPEPPDQVGQVDQMTQHPPLWNLLAAAEITALHLRHVPADRALLALRLLQGALLLPVPWLAWRTARLLRASRRASSSVAFLPLLVPQLLHVGASVTDGDLLLLEMSVATPLLLRVSLGDSRRRVLGALGAVVALTLLTKAFGLVLLPAVLVALVVRRRLARTSPARPVLALAFAAPIVLGGWWYVVRLVQDHALQPSGYPPSIEKALVGTTPAGLAVRQFLVRLAQTSWCDLGWFETPPPLGLVLPLLALIVLPGLWVLTRRSRPGRWWDVHALQVVALTPFVLLLVFVVAGGVSTWRHLHAAYGDQGRYLYPGLVGLGGLLAVALDAAPRAAVRRVLSVLLPLGCVVASGFGLDLAVRHFWSSFPDGALRTALQASPLPRDVVAAVAVTAAVALLSSVVALLRPGPAVRPA